MTTLNEVKNRLEENVKKSGNTYLFPTKKFSDWYKDELLFVRQIVNENVIVFRPFDGNQYTLKAETLVDFKLV
jgi:hypothetical protein